MFIDELMLARALHVLGVVMWIGGVSMVTTVLLPAVNEFSQTADKVTFFERIEKRFAWQARITTLVTGLSGFYMLFVMDAWWRYTQITYWWIHLMTIIWVIFTLMLFVLEPLVLHRWFLEKAQNHPDKTFALIQRMHWILLSISLIAVIGAVVGSHGGRFF
ncbi:MAG: hypothetical protein DRR19_18615 [Candidatus Parabeggiatoa sp. nov. 1]|nr:MAG: hypothetical protein DRR19_18615 [Gammaproteobacteria bacterium]HEC85852.1 hypothetical protein [Thioploca sp.]